MADISIRALIAVRRSNLQRLNIPTFRVAASLAALSVLVGDAFKMAYVDSYIGRSHQPQVVPDGDLDGRDPTW